MPRCVSYRIHDREDGLFDAVATIAPDSTYRRAGFASLAAVEDWIDGLRTLMAAIGAPLVLAQSRPACPEEDTVRIEDLSGSASNAAAERLRRFRDAVSAAEDEAG